MSSNLSVSPVQVEAKQGITGKDVGITAGAAALGALGGGAMYFKTPSEDAFIKAGLKRENKLLKEAAETLTTALKEVTTGDKVISEETKNALKPILADGVEANEQSIKEYLSRTIKGMSDEKIFKKAKDAANEVATGLISKEAAETAESAKATFLESLKDAPADAKKAIENVKKAIEDGADDAVERGSEILKKAKMSAALKWGGIAAATLGILAAAYCFFTKGNDTAAEQAPTEQA